ncbi:AAA family ATPase [Nitrospirillum sp. BR 11828]|uniref:AAA family ATPase n=1 Tax=Nitrospirillum sp. BR 11828 TaxID=3104325 RepID=UPI002ACA03F5|nr:AAA family ATPase [Nitrospirillum sp. BR 11828]MDZ5646158.1 AAA family ATPase [Nitrospirillum sp. BR 11828]
MSLDELGPRICILGPSNSGKSTLAVAIGRARLLPPVHLDQLRHKPFTDWEPRPAEEFVALHDEAIKGDRWVMDGNYSWLLSQRLERATGVILLDTSTTISLFRYLRRSWFERQRPGALDGALDSVKWEMIHYITIATPGNRRRYQTLFDSIERPKIRLSTPRQLADFYRAEGLRR